MQLTASNGAAGDARDMDGRTREGEQSGRDANQACRLRLECLPSRACAAIHAQRARGSVDSFIPMNSPFRLPVYVAPLPAGSILVAR